MKKIICDKCEKEFAIEFSNFYNTGIELDLCKECQQELRKIIMEWLATKKITNPLK